MIDETINSLEFRLKDIKNLVADLSDEQLLAQPVTRMNHAVWNIGHIVYAFQAIGGEMGLSPWLPERWNALFGEGSKLSPDVQDYPSKKELLDALDEGAERVIQKLKAMSSEDLDGLLPDERYRHLYPTLGHAVLDSLIGHTSVHAGYLRAWHTALNLPNSK